MSESCNWNQDTEGLDMWESDCGKYFSLNDGTPKENGMNFCCKCGKPLTESPYEEEGDASDDASQPSPTTSGATEMSSKGILDDSPALNRAAAVILARCVLSGELPHLSVSGREELAKAVLALDEHIRKLTAPTTIAEWQLAKAPLRDNTNQKET